MNKSSKTLELVQIALFTAIIVIMAFTPFLGYIDLVVLPIRITIIHIPVILGSLLLGPKKGAILGFVFGLTSLINNTMNPTITSFVFSPFLSGNILSLLICFLPRILVGVVPYYVYNVISKILKNKGNTASLVAAGLAGSYTNTLLVMNFIYFFFGNSYAEATGKAPELLYNFILFTVTVNGTFEAIGAAILTLAVGKVLIKLKFGSSAIVNKNQIA